MEKLASEAPKCQSLTSLNVGTSCLAVFAEDGQWYRAEIVSCKDQNEASVSFVDYGNIQVCPIASLKSPSSTMIELPRTCIDCILHDVCETDIDAKKAIEHLNATLIDQQVSLEVKSLLTDNNSLEAYIYQGGSADHVNDLLYTLFALEEEEEKVPSKPAEEIPAMLSKEVQPTTAVHSAEPNSSPALSYAKPDITNKESGYCTQVCSATTIKVQLQKYEDPLNKLMEKLALEAPKCQSLSSLNVGTSCLAVFAEDGQWYRAEIVSCKDQNEASVSFVDYGNIQVCPIASLKSPSSTMIELPRTCIDCILHDVCETDIDAKKAIEHLNATLIDQQVSLEVKSLLTDNNSLEAYIYQEGSADHVNDLLYTLFALEEEEVSESDKETSQKVSPQQPPQEIEQTSTAPSVESIASHVPSPSDTQATKFEKGIDIAYPDVTTETSYSAVCYVIDSSLLLRCQLTQYQEQIDQMMVQISNNIEHYPLLDIKDAEARSVCVAKYLADGGWYRGRIVQKNDTGVHVNFVDFGNTEIIPVSDLREIPIECTNLPQTCISVKLHDVHLEDLNVDASKAWLVQQLLEHVVRLEIKGKENIEEVSAFVYSEGRDTHVNDQLYELYSLPEEGEPSPVPIPAAESEVPASKSGIKAICFVVESALVLKCQLAMFSATIDKIMTELGELGPGLVTQDSVTVGEFYAAQYSVDNEWYRVSVLEVTDQTAKVEFIDYGSLETMEVKNLKSLPDHLKATPQTCLKVNLHDVYPEDINHKAAKDYLETTILEQEVYLKMVDDSAMPVVSAYVYAKETAGKHINDYIYEHFAVGEGSTEDSGISVGNYFRRQNSTKTHIILKIALIFICYQT